MTTISLDKNSSSIYKPGTNTVNIKLIRAIDFMQAHSITNIDLMKINIEGGEYDLLEDLISSKYIHCIKNIQVQFHDFVPNAQIRMLNIQNALSQTHYLTYQYPFVWENWQISDKSVYYQSGHSTDVDLSTDFATEINR